MQISGGYPYGGSQQQPTGRPPVAPPGVSAQEWLQAGAPQPAPVERNVIRSDAAVVYGTEGPDLILGGPSDQVIHGLGGDDVIRGGSGVDTIHGGAGDDRLHGDAKSDRIYGGRGDDHVEGNRGNDKLFGQSGTDRVLGGVGDDTLRGGDGDGDQLSGGMGIDVLHGGAGDHDVLRGDAGPDYLDGGGGSGDTISYQTATPPGYDKRVPNPGVLVDLADPVRWRNPHKGVTYTGRAWGGSRAEGGSGEDGIRRIDHVIGSSYDDVIRGNGRSNDVDGGPGFDLVDGKVDRAGAVEAREESGIRPSELVDPVPTHGRTTVELHDSVLGARALFVNAGNQDDEVHVRREGGEIVVTSSRGIVGGGGEVRLPYGSGLDAVVINAGAGNDRVAIEGLPARTSAIIDGGAGDDVLHGGRGDDTLEDGPGNDRLFGHRGDDGLLNQEGRDELRGGKGNDLLVSSSIGEGNELVGGPGIDNASWAQVGERFAVRAEIGGRATSIGGPAGSDRVDGSIDDLEGTELGDVLIGNDRDNGFLGRSGRDTYIGRGGDDSFSARNTEADKRISGGPGEDRATLDPADLGALDVYGVETRHVSDQQYMGG